MIELNVTFYHSLMWIRLFNLNQRIEHIFLNKFLNELNKIEKRM
jgi:hypothetical protein